MTMEETEEVEPADESVPVEPKRLVFFDFIVLATGFASNICEAFVLSLNDAFLIFAAHSNYRKRQVEDRKAVKEFQKQLAGLPTKN